MKPGITIPLKTKSTTKVWPLIAAAGIFLLAGTGCTRPYVSSIERTATAGASTILATSISTLDAPTDTAAATETLQNRTPIGDLVDATPQLIITQPVDTPTEDSNNSTARPPLIYTTQSGDFLKAIAARFGVHPAEITSGENLAKDGLIRPGQVLVIPNVLGNTTPNTTILPDSEIVYSPSALDFDVNKFVNDAGGYLKDYKEELSTGWFTGAQVIERVALENSVNPRLLLALVEYRSHWVYGKPGNLADTDYPLGYVDPSNALLYHQLSWAVQQISIGYYGWRAGILTDLPFKNTKVVQRLNPSLNAGSVAMQYLFAQLDDPTAWNRDMYGDQSFQALHQKMFGDPWTRAQTVEPLYPITLQQPTLVLPFEPGHTWAFTGGPHSAWGPDGALAALDFAPGADAAGCNPSTEWATAMAPGLVVRSENGVVMEDLDGDGYEQTGWDVMYLHIATTDRVPVGTRLAKGDHIGHPSCEGGRATGTHLHIARKYNGEWILADGPVSFNLDGWNTIAGAQPYLGWLTKGNVMIQADQYGSGKASVTRPKNGD